MEGVIFWMGGEERKGTREPSFLLYVLGHTRPVSSKLYCLGGRMASLASFSRMGARRLATVAARTAPRASMQVCNCCHEEKPLQVLGVRLCVFEQELLVCSVQGPGAWRCLVIRNFQTKAGAVLPVASGYRFAMLRQCPRHRRSRGNPSCSPTQSVECIVRFLGPLALAGIHAIESHKAKPLSRDSR